MSDLLVRDAISESPIQRQPMVGDAKSEPFGDRSHVQFESGEFVHMLPITSIVEVVNIKDVA